MENDEEYKMKYRPIVILFIIILLILSFVKAQGKTKSIIIDQTNNNLTVYTPKDEEDSKEEPQKLIEYHIDDPTDYNIERINSEDESIMLIGTLDGYIHAFDSNNNSEKWKISLGTPLVTSYVNIKNSMESNFLFPGPDGNLYYSNPIENAIQVHSYLNVKKLDIPLKNLIEKSPYTLPNMPNYLFIGNRVTNVFIIDISTGVIVSKVTNNNEEDILHQRPVHSNNLATIIRIDYTLKSIDRENGGQMWNVTTSDIMVIEKGSKHELTYNPSLEGSKNPAFQENILTYQVKKHFKNENLNSIINIYKFNKDSPYKIYDNNNTINNNFIDFVDSRVTPNSTGIGMYYLFNDFFKWKKKKLNDFTFSQLKNYISFNVHNHYYNSLNLYVILSMLVIFGLMALLVRTCIRKELYKGELKKRHSNTGFSSADSTSTQNSSSPSKEDSKENNGTALVKCLGLVKKTDHEGDYFEEPVFIEKPIFEEEKKGFIAMVNNLNHLTDEKKQTTIMTKEENGQLIVTKTERKTYEFLDKTQFNLNLNEETQIIEGVEKIGKVLKFKLEEKDNKLIVTQDLKSKYKQKTAIVNALPSGDTEEVLLKKQSGPSPLICKIRTNSLDFAKQYKEDENNNEIIVNKPRKKKKNRSCSPRNNNDLYYSSDVSSNLHLDIQETEKTKSNKSLYMTNNKTKDEDAKNNIKIEGNYLESNLNKIAYGQQFEMNLKKSIPDEINNSKGITYAYDAQFEMSLKKSNADENKQNLSKNNSKINSRGSKFIEINPMKSIKSRISFESLSKSRANRVSSFQDREQSNKDEHSIVPSKIDTHKIKSHRTKELQDNLELLKNACGRFEKDFDKGIVLGEGGFGCVYKAKHRLDGNYYAIKVIEIEVGVGEYLKEVSVLKEVKTMLKLQHKNVVRYYGCWFEPKNDDEIEYYKKPKKKQSKRITNVSKLSETLDFISNKMNSSNLGIKFDTLPDIPDEDKDIIEEEPQEIFSDSEEDDNNKKMYSIDYEKASSSEENKNYSIDDSRVKKNNKKTEETFKVLFYMQMEYCGNETLHQFLQKREKPLDRKTIFGIFKQIALGVAHIHKNGIIHRDLKPANIFMIGKQINLKLGDFGLAADVKDSDKKRNAITQDIAVFNSTGSLNNEFSIKLKENVGTPLYQSPEQLKNLLYNEKVDIYSLGLILLEICSFFGTYHERKKCLGDLRENNIIPEKIRENYPLESELISAMTNHQPNSRPSVQNLLKTESFRKLKEEFDTNYRR